MQRKEQNDFYIMVHRQQVLMIACKVLQCTKIITKQAVLQFAIYQLLKPLFLILAFIVCMLVKFEQ